MPAQLHANNITVERGGLTVLGGVSLTVTPGDRIGLVGPNGAGKSTLLQVLAGLLVPTSGTVAMTPADATVGLLAQEIDSPPGETVAAYLARRTGVAAASAALDDATAALADATPDAFELHQATLDRWLRLGGADLDTRLASALTAVGLDGAAGFEATSTRVLSGGEQARVGLAALILSRYDVILLDEPTNNLDRRGLDQLEELALASAAPMVVVSHDRRFLERVVNAVVELDDHSRTASRYNQTFLGYIEARELARAEAARRYSVNQTQRERLNDRARQQRDWATKGVKAERNPPDNDRAARGFRIDKTEKLASKARQTERALDRLETVDKPWEPWQLHFDIGRAERSGDLVAELVEAEVLVSGPDADAGFGDAGFVLGPLTVAIGAGERVAVLGGNGQGKTTLLRALFGQLPLRAGQQRVGRSVVTGWLDQARDDWSTAARTAGGFLAAFNEATGLSTSEARSLLAKFGLGADDLTRHPDQWSPGERTRAALAGFAARGVNTIVLDEPTNHLDLPAIEQLEQALSRFTGTLILVTHDRAFLDNVTLTRQLVVDSGTITVDAPW